MHWIHAGLGRMRALGLMVAGGALLAAAPALGQADEAAAPAATLPPDGTALVLVNTQVILPIAPGADSAQATFMEVSAGFDRELQGLAAEIDSLLAVYRQQEALLDPAGRERKEQEILMKQQQAATRQQELAVEADRRRAELLSPILERITEVIEGLRAERNYALVLDVAESGVVAADPLLDITGAVLERLGVEIPAAAPGS